MEQIILLADDSVTIQKVLELTLMDEPDLRLICVNDGSKACREIERQKLALVIADVWMPEKNGYEVCTFAKSAQPGIPVLLLVGTFEPFEEAKARAAGADRFIKKPFDSQEALAAIRSLLSSRRSIESARNASDSGKRIFISYRRWDSVDVTGRMYDRLVARYGREGVFRDVDSIPLGADFRQLIDKTMAASRVVIVVIGRSWLKGDESDSTKNALANARDFVRIEIEAALRRKLPIIPVFVGGASMPSEDQLPASLADLCYLNGLALRPDPDFHNDVNRLIAGLDVLMA